MAVVDQDSNEQNNGDFSSTRVLAPLHMFAYSFEEQFQDWILAEALGAMGDSQAVIHKVNGDPETLNIIDVTQFE